MENGWVVKRELCLAVTTEARLVSSWADQTAVMRVDELAGVLAVAKAVEMVVE